jgi:hypothetical protein
VSVGDHAIARHHEAGPAAVAADADDGPDGGIVHRADGRLQFVEQHRSFLSSE